MDNLCDFNNQNTNAGLTLLDSGKIAFPRILSAIQNAKQSVKINMFIWRADNIGLKIANAVLESANRGVKVEISVDRYGFVLELAEESMLSFFHQKPTFAERVKVATLKIIYSTKRVEFLDAQKAVELRDLILSHPNIKVERKTFKADHSKYYLIDNSLLFVGGINIEDKENGADYIGRVYQDYMVEIADNRTIDRFLAKIEGKNTQGYPCFFANLKRKDNLFEMRKAYLDIIKNAKKELTIVMAYISPLKDFMDEIVSAYNRGVKITLLIPERANFQSDLNLKTVRKILKQTNNNIDVYLSPKMVHTKLVLSENVISLGSTNINKKAMNQLDEINLFVENCDSQFTNDLYQSVGENINISKKVKTKEIKYNKFIAFMEGFLM